MLPMSWFAMRHFKASVAILAAIFWFTNAQSFSMWPVVDPKQLAALLGFSQTCLTAL